MFDILRTVLRLGRATEAYPARRPDIPITSIGLPVLNAGACTGAGDCVAACPAGSIRLTGEGSSGRIWGLDLASCVFCGLCARVCPEGAIVLTREFELAARSRQDLIERVAISAAGVGNDAKH